MDADRLIDTASRTARRYLYAIAHNTGVPPADVEDVVQEALLRAWQSRDRLDKPDAFLSWLGRICQCRCIDSINAAARRSALPLDEFRAPSHDDPDTDALIADVHAAIDNLSEKRREVVLLRFDGWTVREIGDLLGIRRRSVESRLKGAMRDLARALWMYE